MFPLLSFLNQFYCEMLHAYRKGHKTDTQLNDLSESKHSLTHHLGQEMEHLRSLRTTPNLESSPSALPSPPELTTSLTLMAIASLPFSFIFASVPVTTKCHYSIQLRGYPLQKCCLPPAHLLGWKEMGGKGLPPWGSPGPQWLSRSCTCSDLQGLGFCLYPWIPLPQGAKASTENMTNTLCSASSAIPDHPSRTKEGISL